MAEHDHYDDDCSCDKCNASRWWVNIIPLVLFCAVLAYMLCSCGSSGGGGSTLAPPPAPPGGSTVTNMTYTSHFIGGNGHLSSQTDGFLTTSLDQNSAGTMIFSFFTNGASNTANLVYPGGDFTAADGRLYHVKIGANNSNVTVDSSGTFGDSASWSLTIVQYPG